MPRLLPVSAVALVLLAAVACGAGDEQGSGTNPTTTAITVTGVTPSIGGPVPATDSTVTPPLTGTLPPPATRSPTTAASEAPTTAAPTTAPPTTVRPRTPVAGFGEVAYRIDGTPAQRCALLAETDAQHTRGLMNRTDLSGYDGMLFVFATNSTGDFWMKDTIMPLSIAWFGSDGRLVSTADMTPCVTAICPTYPAGGAYRYALEVQQGGLGALGIGAGAVISVGGACA